MYLLLIIVLVVLLVGGWPTAPWGGWHSYGYGTPGIIGVLLVVVLVLFLMGKL